MEWFDTCKYIVSGLIGLYAYGDLIFKASQNRFKLINNIVLIVLATLIASAPDLRTLMYFLIPFYIIPLLGVLLAFLLMPINLYLSSRNYSVKTQGLINGFGDGVLIFLVFILFKHFIDYRYENLLIFIVICSETMNFIQRIVVKEGREKHFEIFTMISEVQFLIFASVFLNI